MPKASCVEWSRWFSLYQRGRENPEFGDLIRIQPAAGASARQQRKNVRKNHRPLMRQPERKNPSCRERRGLSRSITFLSRTSGDTPQAFSLVEELQADLIDANAAYGVPTRSSDGAAPSLSARSRSGCWSRSAADAESRRRHEAAARKGAAKDDRLAPLRRALSEIKARLARAMEPEITPGRSRCRPGRRSLLREGRQAWRPATI